MPRASKKANNSDYMPNGVTVSPAIPSPGDKLRVIYDGILAKSGANQVFAHIGYGSKWDNTTFVQMSKVEMGFEAIIPVIESDRLNLCFKDSADNWDNNSGKNYTFDISQ